MELRRFAAHYWKAPQLSSGVSRSPSIFYFTPASELPSSQRVTLLTRFTKLLYRFAAERRIHGVAVRFLGGSAEQWARIEARLAAALEVIHASSPRNEARLRASVRGIWVFGSEGARGSYQPALGLIWLAEDFLLAESTTAVAIASVLVHEITHAWLYTLGFSYAPEIRARIERICLRAELAFINHLPDAAAHRHEIERSLAIPDGYWSAATTRARKIEQLRRLGAPAWLLAVLERRGRARHAG